MPLYAYRCTQCGHRFEKIQNFSAEPEHVCPKCGGVLERPLTAPRLHFKGAGWYVNDYAAKSSAPPTAGSEPRLLNPKAPAAGDKTSATASHRVRTRPSCRAGAGTRYSSGSGSTP